MVPVRIYFKEFAIRSQLGRKGILRESQLYEKLEALVLDKEFVIYGDPAYPLCPLLMKTLRRSSIDSRPTRVQFIHECGQAVC
ncbi:hypothetical protein MRX96_035742 [Rhipicephalus microplus]